MRKNTLREDANQVIATSIAEVLPEKAVKRALESFVMPKGRLILISVGKAAWRMAKAASECVSVSEGIVITKYGHSEGEIDHIRIYEAAHPVSDENGILASEEVLTLTEGLTEDDTVLFLLSGGASALFEVPEISLKEWQRINEALLKSGASITEINPIRKRFSKVKGGKFAARCAPAKVYNLILSDVLGDPLDMIGSGPCVKDSATSEDVLHIVEKYHIELTDEEKELLKREIKGSFDHVKVEICGNLEMLLKAAKEACRNLGYTPVVLKENVTGIAEKEGRAFAEYVVNHGEKGHAYLMGGECVVVVRGEGLGGRSQEFALSAAEAIQGKDICVFAFGSDGTDGPTEAAGGYVDGESYKKCREKGIDPSSVLKRNDSYHALKQISGLIVTGPTGTNVNDLMIAMVAH